MHSDLGKYFGLPIIGARLFVNDLNKEACNIFGEMIEPYLLAVGGNVVSDQLLSFKLKIIKYGDEILDPPSGQ